MYLLDTNACIDFLAGRSEPLAARMGENFGKLFVSTISVAELMAGIRTSTDPERDAKKIGIFVVSVEKVDFDIACARHYGEVVRAIGVRRKSFDRLIGVQALMHGLVLVTRNARDFADVPGLKIEDWSA